MGYPIDHTNGLLLAERGRCTPPDSVNFTGCFALRAAGRQNSHGTGRSLLIQSDWVQGLVALSVSVPGYSTKKVGVYQAAGGKTPALGSIAGTARPSSSSSQRLVAITRSSETPVSMPDRDSI